MPLVLFLQETFGKWQRFVTKLEGWNELVILEQTLLDRARGVFMTKWFGAGLPMHGNALRVFIANFAELEARYELLRLGMLKQRSGLNLTEPLMGMTGMVVGMMAAPLPSIMLLAMWDELSENVGVTIAAALNTLSYGVIPPILVLALGPIALLGVLTWYIKDMPILHEFLAAVTDLLVAARVFLEQLLGPREGVRNPIVRSLLTILDRVAVLLPFLFVFVALVVVHLGARLGPLAKQLDLMIPLFGQVVEVVQTVFHDLFERLQGLYTGKHSPWEIISRVIRTLRGLFKELRKGFVELFKPVGGLFESVNVAKPGEKPKKQMRIITALMNALEKAFDKVMPFVKELTTESWLKKRFDAINKTFDELPALWKQITPPPDATPEKKDEEEGLGAWIAKQRPKPATLAPPTFPKIAAFPDWKMAAVSAAAGMYLSGKPKPTGPFTPPADLFVLDADQERKLKRLKQPTDLFAAERKKLLAGRKLEDVIAQAQSEDERLRALLFAVIDRLLPASVAAEVPKLQGMLWEIDEALYRKRAKYPVRDLPEGDLLKPEVIKLRVRAPGMKRGQVKRWTDDLREALTKQPYRTSAALPAND